MAQAPAADPEASESPAETAKEGPDDQESIVETAQEVGEGMAKIAQALPSLGAPKQAQEQFAGILNAYTQFVQDMASATGAGGTQAEGQGQVPMDQGTTGIPMGPQTRQ